MSVVSLAEAKAFLDVIHSGDDAKLQMLLNGAEAEALQFMNRTTFSGVCPLPGETGMTEVEDPDVIGDSARVAVLLLLQATYQSTPDDAEMLRRAAEVKLMPMRCRMGV